MEKLSKKQTIIVFLFYLLGVLYIMTDQLYLAKEIRFISLLMVFTLIFLVLFVIIKPVRPFALSNTLAVMLLTIMLPLYLVKDIAIDRNFDPKPLVVMACALAFPYIAGIIIAAVRKVGGISSAAVK